ncbi:FadR/GntR family transcriptional regulator [Roseomonas sp. 18066]|uniref:FadR/GntR family transcriptional regulator n=1 Tax=Roseomonas sp. 18066 TaxID=2681412 RepID=UPI0013582EC5|nr:FCD domain-containing protein [Roseomonas sp. 18066]
MDQTSPMRSLLTGVQAQKASNVLADRLREGILTGALAEGAPLPNERALADMSGVSRASVREALRLLEVEGLVRTRSGRGGGSVPHLPGADMLERSIRLFTRGQRVRFGALLETRSAIEPQLARLAALNRTEEDLARLAQIQARFEDDSVGVSAWTHMNVDWHLAVVVASRNELLIGIWKAVSSLMHEATGLEEPYNLPEVRVAVRRVHRRILDAIQKGDGEAAARRMARHLDAYVAHIKPQAPPDLEV